MQKGSMLSTKMITRIGGLIGLSVLLKVYLSFTDGPNWRFSLFGIPLVIIGLLYRPHIAVISGFVVDFLYVLFSPFGFMFNFMTMEAISFALIPSLFVLFFKRENMTDKKIVLSIVIAFLLGFIFNTLQLYIFANFHLPTILPYMPIRIVFSVVNIVVNGVIAPIIYRRVVVPDLKLSSE